MERGRDMIQKEMMKRSPVIINSFGPERVRYGDALKFYIEAEDPDGDMLKIAITADQVGYGHYPTDWIYLKFEQQHYFRGYLQWNTFSSNTPFIREWTQVTLKISVFDKAGNESNKATFPLLFVSDGLSDIELSPPFYEGDPRIGYIDIQLLGFTDAY